ncbi:hypothetical protein D3C81_701990 [compost metagenome]
MRAAVLDAFDLAGKCAQLAGVEQYPQRHLDVARLTGAGNDLGRQQRMPAEGKEVILQADLLQPQHFAPDRRDLLLQRGARFDVFTGGPERFRQCFALDLAAWAQGHLRQVHQQRRDHIGRQLLGQRRQQPGVVLHTTVIAHQLRSGDGLANQYQRLLNTWLAEQTGLNFLRFDAKAAQFHLLVKPAQVLQSPQRRHPARPVTTAVEALAFTFRVRHETFGSQPRPAEIAACQPGPTEQQLARNARGSELQLIIDNPANDVGQRPANRRARAIGLAALPVSDVDRGFGRAITVMQRHLRQHLQHPVTQCRRQRLTAGEQTAQAGAARRQRLLNKNLQQGRNKVQGGHRMLAHQRGNTLRITVLAGACQHQFAAADQRPEAFPHRNVEADRRFLHQHVVLIQHITLLHPLQTFGQCRMGVADALGLPGGAGGIDHISEVIAVQVQPRWLARPAVEIELIHGNGADPVHLRQALQHLAVAEQQARTTVGEHVGQAFTRVIDVQRHIGATGLENRQHADQQLRRTFGGNRHADIRTDALVAQVMGQAVGLLVQAGIVERAALPHQRGALRRQPCLLIELLDDPLLRCRRRCLPPLQQLLTRLRIEQLQVADR